MDTVLKIILTICIAIVIVYVTHIIVAAIGIVIDIALLEITGRLLIFIGAITIMWLLWNDK